MQSIKKHVKLDNLYPHMVKYFVKIFLTRTYIRTLVMFLLSEKKTQGHIILYIRITYLNIFTIFFLSEILI